MTMNNYQIRYLGVLNGPSMAPGDIREESHVIAIRDLEIAKLLLERVTLGNGQMYYLREWGAATLRSLNLDDVLPDRGNTLTLYKLDEPWPVLDETPLRAWQDFLEDNTDPYPDYELTVGSRGGIKAERIH